MSACGTCGVDPCVNPSFCTACRDAGQLKACSGRSRHIAAWGDPAAPTARTNHCRCLAATRRGRNRGIAAVLDEEIEVRVQARLTCAYS